MWPHIGNHLLYYAIPLLLYCILTQYEGIYQYDNMCGIRREQGLNRRKNVRVTWDGVSSRMGDYQFRCVFRMTREFFSLLCFTIICAIGENHFKSQHYIDAFLRVTRMHDASMLATWGYIISEVK